MLAAWPLVLEPSAFRVEIVNNENLKRYESPGVDEVQQN
jgi:hypothetical protein